jgi:hypothetical protein
MEQKEIGIDDSLCDFYVSCMGLTIAIEFPFVGCKLLAVLKLAKYTTANVLFIKRLKN